jgi:hypothetical protein
MTPALFVELALTPALKLLPPRMDTPAARAMVLAIVLQESELKARRQYRGGPARGYGQFELAGVMGVMKHQASAEHASHICELLDVNPVAITIHEALEYQDVLAAAFARLLLWTLPKPLPKREEQRQGWEQYLSAWRPGKPRPFDWPANYALAWVTVTPPHVPVVDVDG